MPEFITSLFDTSGFPARWHCGQWSDELGWLHIVSDLAIFGAYAAIPAVLVFFVLRRKDVPFPPVFWLFAAFILACGTGHLVEATIFWQPWYRLSGAVKLFTATVSWATVLCLIPIVPRALTLPGLSKVNDELRAEVHQRRRAEERFRVMFEATPNAIVLSDEAGRIALVNSHAETLFGHSRDKLIGQSLDLFVPGMRHRVNGGPLPHVPVAGRKVLGADMELSARRSDGQVAPVEISFSPIDTAEGPMVLAVIVDISDRKRADEAMRSLNKTLEDEVAYRTQLIKLLHDVAAICNQAETADSAVRNSITRICRYLGWPVGHAFTLGKPTHAFESSRIWVHEGPESAAIDAFVTHLRSLKFRSGEGWIGELARSGKSHWISDAAAAPGSRPSNVDSPVAVRGVFAFPVIVSDQPVAIIEFFSMEPRDEDTHLMKISREMGRLLGLVVERFALQRALADSVESEQRRIAEELHDGLGQELTAISLMAMGLYRTLESEKSPAAERAKELADAIPGIVRQTRTVIRGLMPVEVDSAGLMSALQQAADATEQRYGISCRLDSTQPVGVRDSTLAHHLYRIAQEALNNCVKHSGADLITIRLNEDSEQIRLEVEDNGRGLVDRDVHNGDPLSRGMGLRIMRHRANLIHGDLIVERAAGGGTIVVCRVGREGGASGW